MERREEGEGRERERRLVLEMERDKIKEEEIGLNFALCVFNTEHIKSSTGLLCKSFKGTFPCRYNYR